MPLRWAPWPGNITAIRPSWATPRTTLGDSPPTAKVSKPASNSPRSRPKITARWANIDRVVVSARPVGVGARSGRARTHCASRPAWSARAASDLADTTHVASGEACSRAAGVEFNCAGSISGACSTMTWALVPLIPNDDTPPRRGLPVCGHARLSVMGCTAPSAQSTCGVGASTCSVAGTVACWIAMMVLITPATPAAAWVCPRFDFTDPSHSGSASRSPPNTSSRARTSMGSPRVVPVPCPSSMSMSPGCIPAALSACRITRC